MVYRILLVVGMATMINTYLAGSARPQFVTVFPHFEQEVEHEEGTLSLNVYKVDNFTGSQQNWRMLEQHLKPKRDSHADLLLVFYYRASAMLPDYQRYIDEFRGKEKITRREVEPLIDEIDDDCLLLYYTTGRKGAFLQNPITKKAELEQLLKLMEKH